MSLSRMKIVRIFQIKRFLIPIALMVIGILFTSCIKDERNLGGNIIPSDYDLKIGIAKIPLPLEAKIIENIQNISKSEGIIGAIRTPEFGVAKFAFGANYCPTSLDYNFGTDAVVKSCYITFLKANTSVADKSQERIIQNLHVYRMTRQIDTFHLYNTGLQDADYIHTPIEDGGIYYMGQDTVRIFLKESFAKQLLAASKKALDSTKHFIDEFKALLFTCDVPDGNGGRLNSFTVNGATLNLSINFKPTWGKDQPRKDTTFQFIFGIDDIQNFSDYDSKALESALPAEYLYAEGIGGLKPYINPVAMKESIDKWVATFGVENNRVIVNRARYHLPITNPANIQDINYYYPAYLYPCFKYSAKGRYEFTPLAEVYSYDNDHGMLNRSTGAYVGDFSTWFQTLLLEEKDKVVQGGEQDIWFSPLSATTSSSYSSSNNTTYSISTDDYIVGRVNGPLHANPPYVEVIYTILPKN